MFGGGNTNALIRAIHDDEDQALAMIKPGRWLDKVSAINDETPLMAAARLGRLQAIEALISAGADPNARAQDAPLICASQSDKATKLLLEAGSDPNVQSAHPNHMGQSPLIAAAQMNRTKVVKLLLEAGADPMHADANGVTAMRTAQDFSAKRTIAVLEKALAHTITAASSLHEAVAIKSVSELQRLLETGQSADSVDDMGRTALHEAALAGWLEGVETLLKVGASVDAIDDREATPIMRIAKGPDAAAIAKALIAAGADVGRTTSKGWTPLHQADDVGVVRALLEAGADPNAAFQYACLLRTPEVIEALIDAGAELNEQALVWARGNRAATRYLKDRLGHAPSTSDCVRNALKDLPRKSQEAEFIAWADRLGNVINRKPAPWKRRKGAMYFHDVSSERICDYLGLPVPRDQDDAHALLAKLSADARVSGYTLFSAGSKALEAEEGSRLPLVLLPICEPLAPVLLCGTNRNDGGDSAELLNLLQQIAEDEPFDVVACGHDYVFGAFHAAVSDTSALATRLLDICPDMADQADAELRNASEVERIRIVAEDLRREKSFLLWWD